jgi:uncharacterized protein YbdZ (MbtH family)
MSSTTTLTSYRDPSTYRVVRDVEHYAVVHPSYPIPYGWDWLADCATEADALAYANDRMQSDALMATVGG